MDGADSSETDLSGHRGHKPVKGFSLPATPCHVQLHACPEAATPPDLCLKMGIRKAGGVSESQRSDGPVGPGEGLEHRKAHAGTLTSR